MKKKSNTHIFGKTKHKVRVLFRPTQLYSGEVQVMIEEYERIINSIMPTSPSCHSHTSRKSSLCNIHFPTSHPLTSHITSDTRLLPFLIEISFTHPRCSCSVTELSGLHCLTSLVYLREGKGSYKY
jgi:hypothetical protein